MKPKRNVFGILLALTLTSLAASLSNCSTSRVSPMSDAGRCHVGVYPGSFDPIGLGHREVIEIALQRCDRLVIVARTLKPTHESVANRMLLIRAATSDLADRVQLVAEPRPGLKSLVQDLSASRVNTVTLIFGSDGFQKNYESFRDHPVDFLVIEQPSPTAAPTLASGLSRVRVASGNKGGIRTSDHDLFVKPEKYLHSAVLRLIEKEGMYQERRSASKRP